MTVTVDRFDPGHEIPGKPGVCRPTAKLPGDHVIPLTVAVNKEFDSTTHTEEDFKNTFQVLNLICFVEIGIVCAHYCCGPPAMLVLSCSTVCMYVWMDVRSRQH